MNAINLRNVLIFINANELEFVQQLSFRLPLCALISDNAHFVRLNHTYSMITYKKIDIQPRFSTLFLLFFMCRLLFQIKPTI